MIRTLLVRGIYAGMAAGLLSWLFSYVFGEPGIEGGIAFEEQLAHAGGESQGGELVSRGLQATVGLGAALIVFGVAIGGLFALAYAVAYGRIGSLSPRATAAVLATGAFLVVFLVPFLKYPANPPATSDDATIAQRTGLFLGLVLVSVILAVASAVLGRQLNARLGAWNAVLVAIGMYVVTIGVVLFVLPTVNEMPAGFPATVLYQFRLASVGNQVVLWATIGLLFGWLTDRSLRRSQAVPRVGNASGD
ncbi:MAG: CbtA family protein [Actinomycetota bacterium]|nr:CbtA family protein [Actinomycetota bacterium]